MNEPGDYNYFNSPNFTEANENSYIAYVAPDDECSALNTAKRNIIPGEENLLSDVEGESPTIDPIFDGGTLTVSESGETAQDFLVNDVDGNTIDSNDNTVRFEGDFEGNGGLTFIGSDIGSESVLSGKNTYNGTTVVQEGILEITNVNGLGSTDAGTRVEKGAILRISVDGESTPQGSPSNDAQINEKITLTGGELDLNGNYIDLRKGVVLEGKGVNSTIRVKVK